MAQTLALVILILGTMMAVPGLVDFALGNRDWIAFAAASTSSLTLGMLLFVATRRQAIDMTRREIFLFVPTSWLISAALAALPFYFSNLGLSYTDAFFEATSGLTTTGSTVLTELDTKPPGILLWRSMTQWIGGLGIVVMGLILLPFLKSGGQQLFQLESSDKSGKPFAHASTFSKRIAYTYLALSILCVIAYASLGMTTFEAVNHAMTTVSTGGYSTSDASMGQFGSTAMLITSSLFMFIGGLPFLFLIYLAGGRFERDQQIRYYVAITIVATLCLFAISAIRYDDGGLHRFASTLFNVVSVITTTGYASEDYQLWGPSAVVIFFFLTFIGGCAGSTAGGFKQFRIVVVQQVVVSALTRTFRPNQMVKMRYGTRRLEPTVTESVMVFSMLYTATFIFFAIIYGLYGLDFETAISASATAIANVGPGLGPVIGPAGNFATLADPIKWMLCFEMIVGRLEMMTVFVLLMPGFWQ
ncbi:TrkH family potassium uptake protein (plasmid) [Hoeflea sp. Naph1]|uniref:TrkH family potassium uptake protein n=1 Tax=Hoeflea sp. Naph1 TaxID=3388653 RepID=UPI00398FEAD4